jgi:pimeloyl-ACP methyl ester carboxylesterase
MNDSIPATQAIPSITHPQFREEIAMNTILITESSSGIGLLDATAKTPHVAGMHTLNDSRISSKRGPRHGIALVAAALALLVALLYTPRHAHADRGSSRVRDIVLVHGAWADGSSWSDVIEQLQRDGYTVRAAQLPLTSLDDDVAVVHRELARIDRPVVLVGHSYGGAVISEAATDAPNVVGLVYVAAYMPDAGETLGALSARFPATPLMSALEFDTEGNATVEPGGFVRWFAGDLPERQARVLASVQKPIAAAILGTPGGQPAWRDLPSWYVVARDDQAIAPALERFMAARAKSRTIELSASHAVLISRSHAVADLIERAATACTAR